MIEIAASGYGDVTVEASLERLAVHEAAHAVAGFTFGRPIGTVSIRPDGTTDGRAGVATIKRPSFTEVIEDCIISLVADIAAGTTGILSPPLDDWPESDETAAVTIASKASRSPDEAIAVVALARARARQLLEDVDFWALAEALSRRLLIEREMTGNAVVELFLDCLDA